MSMYAQIKTQFKNPEALVEALIETSGRWTREQIEVHAEAQHLFGYEGRKRPQKGHIIVRREFVGAAANDLGFELQPDGTYLAHISDFDSSKINEAWRKRLAQNYAYHAIRIPQERAGRRVSRERLENGRQRVTIGGYR